MLSLQTAIKGRRDQEAQGHETALVMALGPNGKFRVSKVVWVANMH
jgi:hypothetical protein